MLRVNWPHHNNEHAESRAMPDATESPAGFAQAELITVLDAMDVAQLDALDFGVIHFDGAYIVRRYNLYEQVNTGLRPERVLGHHVFTDVAQCMNNFMVAEQFEEARNQQLPLDSTIDYVLTWRMKPTPVKLRMLSAPETPGGYILLKRLS